MSRVEQPCQLVHALESSRLFGNHKYLMLILDKSLHFSEADAYCCPRVVLNKRVFKFDKLARDA